MQSKLTNWLKATALAAVTAVGVSQAEAGLTTIGRRPDNEVGQEGILEHQYGGDWHRVGTDFYNGSMRAMRMDDFLTTPGALNIADGECGYSDDETWCGSKFTATAVAKFSGNTQRLATVDKSGHSHDLLNVHGFGFDIDAATATVNMHGDEFSWLRKGDSGTQSSIDGKNADLRDHLITYVIEGLPGVTGPVWMMFWEDMNRFSNTPQRRTWADYNDLAVEIRSVVHPVPLPPAGWAGLTTLCGFAVIRARKLLSKASLA